MADRRLRTWREAVSKRWICLDCGAAFAVQGIAPKMCYAGGSKRIGRVSSVEPARNFAEKRAELESVCAKLDELRSKYA